MNGVPFVVSCNQHWSRRCLAYLMAVCAASGLRLRFGERVIGRRRKPTSSGAKSTKLYRQPSDERPEEDGREGQATQASNGTELLPERADPALTGMQRDPRRKRPGSLASSQRVHRRGSGCHRLARRRHATQLHGRAATTTRWARLTRPLTTSTSSTTCLWRAEKCPSLTEASGRVGATHRWARFIHQSMAGRDEGAIRSPRS